MKLLTHLLVELLCPLLLQLRDTRTLPCVGCAAESSPIWKIYLFNLDHRIESLKISIYFGIGSHRKRFGMIGHWINILYCTFLGRLANYFPKNIKK